MRPAPFGPLGERARIWHPLVILIGSFIAFYVWAILPSVVLASMDAAAGKTDLMAPDSALVQYGLAALAVSFGLILLHFVFWTRVIERRPLTSIGLFRGGSGSKYVNGLVYGVLFALLVNLIAVVASLHFGFSMPAMFTGNAPILRPDLLLFVAMIIPAVLLQGGTEEVVFRGWMLSALSARTSITLAVLVSGLAFGLFHVDRFVLDPVFAAIFISSTVVMGVFLGVWAVKAGSIVGPMGFHGAYNALLFVTGFLDGAAKAKPGQSTAQIWSDMMSMENMQEAIRNMDFVAAMQTGVVICSLIAIAVMLLSGREEEDH
jgi:membrane protease YdiL (CAAX protease family)